MSKETELKESRDDLLCCCKNLAVWLEGYIDGVTNDEDLDDIKGDLADAREAITNVYPRVYTFSCEHESIGAMVKTIWSLYCNDIPLELETRNGDYSVAVRWGRKDIEAVFHTALIILENEGYEDDEIMESHEAFGRDVIGCITVKEDVELTSHEIKKWMDDYDVTEYESEESDGDESG